MTIPFSSIVEGNRARKNYGDLEGLKESLKSLGSIHPIVLSRVTYFGGDGEGDIGYVLVAGGRRYSAMKELGVTELHHGSVLNPTKLGFVFENEVPEDVRREAELDENLYRLKPKWFEDCVLVADVHALKREKLGHKWGIRQTSDLLGKGYGQSNVSLAIRLAKLIRANDEDVLDCETMSDGIALLFKRSEDASLAELQKRAIPQVTSMGSFLDPSFSISLTKRKEGDAPSTKLTEVTTTQQDALYSTTNVLPDGGAPVNVPLSKMFVRGDAIETMSSLPNACFDHVVTDIPYGIDMDNLDTIKNISDVEAEHEVEANVKLMEPFLTQAFRLVKSGGFCVFFYDLDWHEYLQATAETIGWRVQRWPLIAHKTSACQNNAAQYNFTKDYECVMVLRRDERTVLRNRQSSSVWVGDFSAERRLYNNPFAKPFDLWKWLFSAVAFSGQSVLDPFCGEMSSCRAAVNCGLIPFGIEINEKHFNRGLENMKAVYALVHKSNVQFT